ncbi:putative Fis family transcriptional regulator [Magnetofaba australis IT-1]|uniref:Putative Fis family transcriptional regulator n=2 Tax=Magnetofaba TaxID=1472292 RepID=A0A1Y2JZB9_9PROT|nr:putative Fis family transcriptional regulator [Magnetofaba australis IT-1]
MAATEAPILIQGGTGSGKSLLAEAMHQASARAGGPFVVINCAALSPERAEALLLGDANAPGMLAQADGGSVLLDEVGELPAGLQGALLQFLESGVITPSGCAAQRVDARVLATTRVDLRAEALAGRFREDLFFRLSVAPLALPALIERNGDVQALMQQFLNEIAAKHGIESPRFDGEAARLLGRYRWPGNVRELRNFCERMAILYAGSDVTAEMLPVEFHEAAAPGLMGAAHSLAQYVMPDEGVDFTELERSVLRQALDKARGNRSRAARLLSMSRDTLLYRMRKFALE